MLAALAAFWVACTVTMLVLALIDDRRPTGTDWRPLAFTLAVVLALALPALA